MRKSLPAIITGHGAGRMVSPQTARTGNGPKSIAPCAERATVVLSSAAPVSPALGTGMATRLQTAMNGAFRISHVPFAARCSTSAKCAATTSGVAIRLLSLPAVKHPARKFLIAPSAVKEAVPVKSLPRAMIGASGSGKSKPPAIRKACASATASAATCVMKIMCRAANISGVNG